MAYVLRRRLARLVAVALPALVCGVQVAWSQEWIVQRVTGQAWVQTNGATPVRITAGMTIPGDAQVTTSSRGRVMLRSDQGSIVVAPDTLIRVGEAEPDATTVLQDKGRAEYEIEKQGLPHFAVETPLLSAVVKGTHFTVSITTLLDLVSVDRGTVQVAERTSGKTAEVSAGQRAISKPGRGGGFSVAGKGALPKIHVESSPASPIGWSPASPPAALAAAAKQPAPPAGPLLSPARPTL